MSRAAVAISKDQAKEVGPDEKTTFLAAGIKPLIAAALHAAFPSVEYPTSMQRRLINGILKKQDILLQDQTGSGKSFALTLALLSKPRVSARVSPGDKTPAEVITTLLIVPHRDLAYQFLHWIYYLVTSTPNTSPSAFSSTVQVLVRGVPPSPPDAHGSHALSMFSSVLDPRTANLSVLTQRPPHILIGTPQAIFDAFERDPRALQLSTLSAVVVDEIDSILEWTPSHASRREKEKMQRKLAKHPAPLKKLLDMIYPSEQDPEPQQGRRDLVRTGFAPACRPQLIVLSATLRNRLRTAFFGAFGWFQKGKVLKIINSTATSPASRGVTKGIQHHVLIVSEDGAIRNIDGSVPPLAIESEDLPGDEHLLEAEDSDLADQFLSEDDGIPENEYTADFANTPSTVNILTLEAVAAAFALDVPSVALLVLPATASVHRAIFDLRELGVNAHGLDLMADERGRAYLLSKDAEDADENPTLLVSTLATTRGIDLPVLTHVFHIGIPEGRSNDAYLHIAGRVGRFGRRGRMITVLEDRQETAAANGKLVVRDEPKKMSAIFSQIKISPIQFEHFD